MMLRIGDIIREMRIKRGLSQAQLGDLVGVGRSAISNYEKGFRIPDLEIAEKLADAFGVSFGDFVGGQELTDQELRNPLPTNVRPISEMHHQHIPMIGTVAAGEPIYSPEELGVYVDSPMAADAAITIQGDSMAPTYQDGDVVYIKCKPDIPEGAIAVVFLDDEATLKHVYKRPTGLTLISDNPAHAPIMVEFEDYASVRIFGVPVGFTRIYKKEYKRPRR